MRAGLKGGAVVRMRCWRAGALALCFVAGAAFAQVTWAQSGSNPAPATSTPQSQTGGNGAASGDDAKPIPAPTSKDKAKDGGASTTDDGLTKVKLRITNNQDKPVANASVYIRFNESGGLFHKDHLSEMNFKTNDDGSVKIPEVPIGKVLIQIIAKGYHTYGKWYDIEKDPDEISIKLDPPPHWY